jgi:chemotaxis protein MotD
VERRNGFSTLVDSNVTAASSHDGNRSAERAPPSTTARASTATEPRRTSREQPSRTEPRDKPAAASETGTRIERNTDTDRTDTAASAQDTETTDAAQTDSETTTDAATAAQLAQEVGAAVSVIDSNDAIPVTNPPATVVPTPAETAAAALNRVAADTALKPTGVVAGANGETPAESVTAAIPLPTEIAAGGEIDAGKATAQVEAKVQNDLATTTGKPTEAKPEDTQHGKLTARTDVDAVAQDDNQKPAEGASDQRRQDIAEAKGGAQAHATADRLETDTPKPTKPAHEPVAPASPIHAQSATDLLQPNGFGLSHVSAPHAAATIQAAQLTAVAANSTPVPLNGLAVEIVANAQIGRNRFEIRLDPPELGRIDVKLDVDRQGQVTSHLIVEKASTLDMLRRDAPQLERALQDAGLKTSDSGLQFSLRDQSQSGRNDNNDSGRNAHRLHIAEDETIAAEPAARGYGRMIGHRGGIDIRV